MRQCKHPLINQKFEQIHASSCWVPPFRGWIATVRFLPLIWIGAMSTDSWISDSLRCQLFHPSPQLFEQYDHGLQSYHLRFQCSKTAKAAKQSGNIKQWRPSLQFCNSVVGCSVVVSPSCVTSLSKGLELLHVPFSHYLHYNLTAHSKQRAIVCGGSVLLNTSIMSAKGAELSCIASSSEAKLWNSVSFRFGTTSALTPHMIGWHDWELWKLRLKSRSKMKKSGFDAPLTPAVLCAWFGGLGFCKCRASSSEYWLKC